MWELGGHLSVAAFTTKGQGKVEVERLSGLISGFGSSLLLRWVV